MLVAVCEAVGHTVLGASSGLDSFQALREEVATKLPTCPALWRLSLPALVTALTPELARAYALTRARLAAGETYYDIAGQTKANFDPAGLKKFSRATQLIVHPDRFPTVAAGRLSDDLQCLLRYQIGSRRAVPTEEDIIACMSAEVNENAKCLNRIIQVLSDDVLRRRYNERGAADDIDDSGSSASDDDEEGSSASDEESGDEEPSDGEDLGSQDTASSDESVCRDSDEDESRERRRTERETGAGGRGSSRGGRKGRGGRGAGRGASRGARRGASRGASRADAGTGKKRSATDTASDAGRSKRRRTGAPPPRQATTQVVTVSTSLGVLWSGGVIHNVEFRCGPESASASCTASIKAPLQCAPGTELRSPYPGRVMLDGRTEPIHFCFRCADDMPTYGWTIMSSDPESIGNLSLQRTVLVPLADIVLGGVVEVTMPDGSVRPQIITAGRSFRQPIVLEGQGFKRRNVDGTELRTGDLVMNVDVAITRVQETANPVWRRVLGLMGRVISGVGLDQMERLCASVELHSV